MVTTPAHLGGFVPGGDDATWYPDLWDWLVHEIHDVHEIHVKRVLDVGCGDGQAVEYFANLGCEVTGIEGVAQESPLIVQHDYTEGALAVMTHPFDLVWSCEFVEHVDERYVPNFLMTFKLGKLLLMTHAAPGQGGYHHVNCQPREYWCGAMAAIGFTLDANLTAKTRELAARNTNPYNHYVRSGMAFRNNAYEEAE